MGQTYNKTSFLVSTEARYEIRAFAEDVEEIQDSQDNAHITGCQQSGQVFHGAVQVSSKAMLNEQGHERQTGQ